MSTSKYATAKDPSLLLNFFMFTKKTVNIIKHEHICMDIIRHIPNSFFG